MSLLEDLVGQPLHTVDDDVLEEIIMKGRVAQEYTEPTKKVKKTAVKKVKEPDFDLDEFE